MESIGYYSFLFLGFTLLNRILEGQLVTSTEIATVNSWAVFTSYEFAGFTIPVPNINFLTGLARLAKWDYSFFGGTAEIIMFFFYALSAALAIFFFTIAISTVTSFFARRT